MNGQNASHLRNTAAGGARPDEGLTSTRQVDVYIFEARRMRAEMIKSGLTALWRRLAHPFRRSHILNAGDAGLIGSR